MVIGIEHYAFATFIAVLICIVAVIFKVLFANVKRQQKLLDERETQILQLYNAIETIMEEFGDQVKASMDEIKAAEYRAITQMKALELSQKLEQTEQRFDKAQLPKTEPPGANQVKAAEKVLDRTERVLKHDYLINEEALKVQSEKKQQNSAVFQKFFDDAADAPPVDYNKLTGAPTKNEKIKALAEEGKTDIEIARHLGITAGEVQLITSLM